MKDLLGGNRDNLPAQGNDGGWGYMFPAVQLSVVLLLVAVYPTHFPPLTTHQHIVGTIRLLDLILHRDKQLFTMRRRHSRELRGAVNPGRLVTVDDHSDTCFRPHSEDHVTRRVAPLGIETPTDARPALVLPGLRPQPWGIPRKTPLSLRHPTSEGRKQVDIWATLAWLLCCCRGVCTGKDPNILL